MTLAASAHHQQARMRAFLGRLERDHPGCHALIDAARVDAALREIGARLVNPNLLDLESRPSR
jgi:hypothetical protein